MNESEFNDIVDDILINIEDALEDASDESGVDIDYETTGGILKITFQDQSQIIINRQTPLKEIWVATKLGGFHFGFNKENNTWQCSDKEFYAALSEYISEHAGTRLTLNL